MRPLIALRGPAANASLGPRDPAPSRMAYRWERLWLTPLFRKLCRVGLPITALLVTIGVWLANEANQRMITDWVAEVRREIESRPEFQVNVVGITGASTDLAAEIRVVLGINLPVSSFDLDLDMLRNRITGLPAVAAAELRIRGGGYLAVEIEERQPAMIWQTRGGPVLIDRDGVFVAALSDRPETPALPQIAGEGADLVADEALALFAAAAPLGNQLRGFVRMGERRWDLVLSDERRVQLPAHGAVAALERLVVLDAADALLSGDVLRVDMRNPDRVTIQLGPDAQAELHSMRAFQAQTRGDDRE